MWMNASKTIDMQLLMDCSGHDNELASELIRLFLELADHDMAALGQAVADGDAAEVRAITHKCAGSSLTCGMRDLAELMRALELDASLGVLDHAEEHMQKIKKAFIHVKADAVVCLEQMMSSGSEQRVVI